MSSSKKVASGVIWSVIVNFVNAIYGFIATPILIRYFGRDDYGLIILAQSANAYMFLFDLGLSSTTVRFFSEWISRGYIDKVRKLMQTCTAFYSVIGFINIIVLICVFLYSDILFNVTAEQNEIMKSMIIVLMATAFINWYTSCWVQLISATENVAWVQKRTLISKILMIVVLLSTIFFKLSILEYFVMNTVASLSLVPLTWYKMKKETPYVNISANFDRLIFKEILPYSINIFSFGIFQMAFFNSRALFLGMRADVASVTDFNILNSLANVVILVGNVFMGALLPSATRVVAKGDRDGFDRVAYQGTRFVSITLCLCSFGLITINEDILILYVGEDFLYLIPWLNIWLLFVLSNHNSCISSLIFSGTEVKAITYSSIISSISALVFMWFVIPHMKVGGVVIAYCIYVTMQLCFYYFYYWRIKMRIDTCKVFIESFLPFVSIGAIISTIIKQLPHTSNHWVNVFILGLSFAFLYMVCSYFFLKQEDIIFIKNVITNKNKQS